MATKLKLVGEDDRLYRWLTMTADKWQSWYSEACVNRHFFEGRQWTAEEAAKLKETGQPVITINHIWGKVSTLVGFLLKQRPTIKYSPRGKNDAALASIATKVVRYIMDINKIQRKAAEAFTDMASVGVGWVNCYVTTELTRDPIVIEYVPWDEVIPDWLSKQPDFSDARFIFRGKWVDADLFVEFFPDAKKVIDEGYHTSKGILPWIQEEWFDRRRHRVFVVEAQYKVFERKPCYWDGIQAVRYVEEVHRGLLDRGIGRIIEARIPVVRRAIIVGSYIVEDVELPYLHGGFTFVPFVAFRDMNGNPYGIVSLLRDMQIEINKRRSKVLHYLSAKRVIAEEGAIDDPDEFMEELMRPDAFLTYKKGYEVRVEQDLELGAQHFELMKSAAQEMTVISGIYPDFMGMPTNARTGAALRQRVIQSQVPIQKFFTALEMGLQQIAEICLALARQYYRGERWIQLTDEPEAFVINEPVQLEDGTIQIRNSLAELNGDIIVSVVSGGLTERQEQLTQLVELFKALPPEAILMSLDLLIDAFDVPQKTEIKRRYAYLLQNMMQQRQQEQQGGGENVRTTNAEPTR